MGLCSPAISTTVEFSVTEPLFIQPPHAYITRASDIQFLLETRTDLSRGFDEAPSDDPGDGVMLQALIPRIEKSPNRLRVIAMPSPQYKWEVGNPTAVGIDSETGLATGKQHGESKVVVRDRLLEDHTTEATVFVVPPHRLELRLYPRDAKAYAC